MGKVGADAARQAGAKGSKPAGARQTCWQVAGGLGWRAAAVATHVCAQAGVRAAIVVGDGHTAVGVLVGRVCVAHVVGAAKRAEGNGRRQAAAAREIRDGPCRTE